MKKYVWTICCFLCSSNAFAYLPPSVRKNTSFIDIFFAAAVISLIGYLLSFLLGKGVNGLTRVFNPKLWEESKKATVNKNENKSTGVRHV